MPRKLSKHLERRQHCTVNLTKAYADEFVEDQRSGLGGGVRSLDPVRRLKLRQALTIAYNTGYAFGKIDGVEEGLRDAAKDDTKGARIQNVREAILAFHMSADRHRKRVIELRHEKSKTRTNDKRATEG